MKAKITERFSIIYMGEPRSYPVGAIVEGWPAKRAIAARKAVPFQATEAPENKAGFPAELK